MYLSLIQPHASQEKVKLLLVQWNTLENLRLAIYSKRTPDGRITLQAAVLGFPSSSFQLISLPSLSFIIPDS